MWRGLMLNRGVTHFLQDVAWGDDLDYLFVDMPPGTGDVQMGVAKLLPRAEVIVVTTPARGAQKVASRAVSMARKSYLRVAGVIENMSTFTCEHGSTYSLFGEGGGAELAADAGVPLLGQVPARAGGVRRAATPASRWCWARVRPPTRSGPSPTASSPRRSRRRRWPAAAPGCSTPPWPRSTRSSDARAALGARPAARPRLCPRALPSSLSLSRWAHTVPCGHRHQLLDEVGVEAARRSRRRWSVPAADGVEDLLPRACARWSRYSSILATRLLDEVAVAGGDRPEARAQAP